MPLPDPAVFFRPEPHSQLTQGDIVLAPTASLWSETARPPVFMPITASPAMGEPVTVPLWDDYGPSAAPITVVEATWGPAMVLSHNCELDKEFNREVRRLIDREARSEAEAIEVAPADESLDPHVVLSP